MRERKMFFPPALRLAAVAIALSAAALALPLPVFAVLDRAAGHSIAVQQDAEALSPAGRSCAAARELYCWRMTCQHCPHPCRGAAAAGGRGTACQHGGCASFCHTPNRQLYYLH